MDNFGLFYIINSAPYIAPCANPLPPVWQEAHSVLAEMVSNGKCFHNKKRKLAVISSLDTMKDGKKYLHISLSHNDHIPDWNTMKYVKDLFIGKERDAFIYFPVESEYVNFKPYCLHLWSEHYGS